MALNAEEKLTKARLQLIMDHPFWGHLALKMPFIESETAGGHRTTAVDPQGRFFYNKDWIGKMSLRDVRFEIAHEVMHLVQQCSARFPNGGNHQLWNLAADYVIDTILVDSEFSQSEVSKKMVKAEIQKMARDKTTEQVYYQLLKKGKGDKKGGSTSQPGTGDPGPPSSGEQHPDNIRGCASAALQKKLDPETVEKWKQHIMAAAQIAKTKGDLPGFAANFVAELTKPTVTWRSILRHLSMSTFKGRYTFRRPGRRSYATGMRMTSREPTKLGAVIAIDTSGSIDDVEINQFLTECVQIMKECGAPWLHIFFHDVRCYHNERYTKDTIKRIKVKRGGTSHIHVFDKIEEVLLPKEIGMVVCFTDLYTDFPLNKPNYRVVWGCVPNGMGQGVPWGQIVEVKLAS